MVPTIDPEVGSGCFPIFSGFFDELRAAADTDPLVKLSPCAFFTFDRLTPYPNRKGAGPRLRWFCS